MNKAIGLVDTIHGFPKNWKNSFEALVELRQFIKKEKIDFDLTVLIDKNKSNQNKCLIPFKTKHLSGIFFNHKFNQPYFAFSTILEKYFKNNQLDPLAISEVFYFSSINWGDFEIQSFFPNAQITLINMQNHTQNCLKDWSEEDLKACHLENWTQVDLQDFLPSIQSLLLKEKYNTSFNQTKKQNSSIRI